MGVSSEAASAGLAASSAAVGSCGSGGGSTFGFGLLTIGEHLSSNSWGKVASNVQWLYNYKYN